MLKGADRRRGGGPCEGGSKMRRCVYVSACVLECESTLRGVKEEGCDAT